jgi:ribosomal protein S18 acetylase RimI-like enzyme
MITYRNFQNTDPPSVVQVWRSRAGQPGLLQPVSADLFEQFVFGKLYFDHQGLILAWDAGRPVGFAHAGFGPDEDENCMSHDLGVTCVLVVRPDAPEPDKLAAELLQRCERYLEQNGAKVLYGGCIRPLNPFYLGLYGGSELPGVLQSDALAQQCFRTHGYREIDQTQIFERDLNGFQTPVDRAVMQCRRQMTVQASVDSPVRTWWEACTIGDFDLMRFELMARGGGKVLAQATFRNMEPTGANANAFVRQAGLIELEVDAAHRRQCLATFLLGDAFDYFVRQGITQVQVQTMARNTAAVGLYRKLGFTQVDTGTVFRKEA